MCKILTRCQEPIRLQKKRGKEKRNVKSKLSKITGEKLIKNAIGTGPMTTRVIP